MQSLFGTDGIRGVFEKEITYSLAYRVGYAAGLFLDNNNPLLIGRDTRSSGKILTEALAKGVKKSGKDVIDLGICPTPAIPFLIEREKFSGGIMISASHNPPIYNGIKIFDNKGKKISKKVENKIQTKISEINGNNLFQTKNVSINTKEGLLDIYVQSLIETMEGGNLYGMKIILDACYGSATTCAEKVFNSIGANVKVINNEKNGLKINLNCGSTNLEPIRKAVLDNEADMGFSFDGDADRVIGVDSKGNILDGDHILFLWGRELLIQNSLTNNLLISTKMANLGLEHKWKEVGGTLFRTEVGDKFIYEAIIKKNALLGGEQSGHILSKMNNFSGDGILTAIQIAKFCKEKNISLENWLQSSFKPFPQRLTNINLNFDINKIDSRSKKFFYKTIGDYSKYSSKNCRIYIRPSGTEPLLRVLVEAEDKQRVNNLSSKIIAELIEEIDKIS